MNHNNPTTVFRGMSSYNRRRRVNSSAQWLGLAVGLCIGGSVLALAVFAPVAFLGFVVVGALASFAGAF